MKKTALILFLAAWGCGGNCRGDAATGFETWAEQDQAIRRNADRAISLGDFDLRLPLGWVRAGEDRLLFLGSRAGNTTPLATAVLSTQDESNTERSSIRFSGWPSRFSGWKTIRNDTLWMLQATLPDNEGARQIVRIPSTTQTLTVEYSSTSARSNPDPLQSLLERIRYTGSGKPLAPPDEKAPNSSYRSAAAPARSTHSPLSGASALQPVALEALKNMQKGNDPALDNRMLLLGQADDALLLRLHLMRHAQHSIKIQTFIWKNDELGRLFMYELIQAARRGVQVRIIADHFASMRDVDLAAFLATVHPAFRMRHYRPAAGRLDPSLALESLDYILPNNTNQRMHNKLMIVDDVLFITGGRNIANEYFNRSSGLNFRDRDVLVAGPMSAYASASFDAYWDYSESVPTEKLKDVARAIKKNKFKRLNRREDFELHGLFDDLEDKIQNQPLIRSKFVEPLHQAQRALFLADPPGKETRVYTAWRRGTIARQLEAAIKSTEQNLLLQTPYLVLDGGMLKIFRDLRKQNPDMAIRLSSNSFGSTDNLLTYAANFKLRPLYIRDARLSVFEYMPHPAAQAELMPNAGPIASKFSAPEGLRSAPRGKPFLCIHAKSFVVDNRLAFVGSYNFDPRSIALNTEVGLVVEDPVVAAQLRRQIETDISPSNSWVIARRGEPRSLEGITRGLPDKAGHSRAEIWSARHTTSYELKEVGEPVYPEHPLFYRYYRDAGIFPGADEDLTLREVLTLISSKLTALTIPLL